MRFGVLGDVEVRVDGGVLPLGRRRERLLLGVLLLRRGRAAPMSELIDLLWEENPPDSARRSVQVHVARLRASLRRGDSGVRLVGRTGGYALEADPHTVDAHRFQDMVDRAAHLTDPGARARLLRVALDLWRGPVLGGDATERLRERVGAKLEALRLYAAERLFAALIALGRHEEALPDLSRMAQEHPSRERLTELHMSALHRAGRTAEALAAYQSTRDWLAEQLGVDPGRALQRLHLAILRDEPLPAERDERLARRPPAELPADTAGFVGRDRELAALREHAARDTGTAIVITGPAGVGKTAMAVRFGHRVADRFSDGQLYLNLRGYDQRPPMSPAEALTRMLTSLGVHAEQIPAEAEAAAAMYRTQLRGSRTLVLLDNAASADQVRPLLPAEPRCLALVTSRDQLGGLLVSHGAQRLVLQTLEMPESRRLLRELIGANRAEADSAAVVELAELCGRLPLALRIAGAHLATRPEWSVADYVTALRADRLGMLDMDGDTAVEGAFRLTYQRLPAAAQRMFRWLGLAPGPDITAEAAAALAQTDVAEAAGLLDQLAAVHLLEHPCPGRYAFHDLLKLHAQAQAEREDDPAIRRAAAQRLHAWYLGAAAAAAVSGYGHIPRPPEIDAWAARAEGTFDTPSDATAWLDAERGNLTAAVTHTAEHGPSHIAWLLAAALRGYFLLRPHLADALIVGQAALRAASEADDPAGLAAAHLSVATIASHRSLSAESIRGFAAAAEFSRRADWPGGVAAAYNNRATVHLNRGELRQAADHLSAAMRAFREAGDDRGEAVVVGNLGELSLKLGRLAEAAEQLRRAVALHGRGFTLTAAPLTNLATTYRLLGRLDEAQAHATEALTLHRRSGSRHGEAMAEQALAAAHRDAGRLDLAREHIGRALRLAEESGSVEAKTEALSTSGTIYQQSGQHQQALAAHQGALRRAAEPGVPQLPYLEAAATLGVAMACLSLGRLRAAQRLAQRSLRLSQDTGCLVLQADAQAALVEICHALQDTEAAREHAEHAIAGYREAGCAPAEKRMRAAWTSVDGAATSS